MNQEEIAQLAAQQQAQQAAAQQAQLAAQNQQQGVPGAGGGQMEQAQINALRDQVLAAVQNQLQAQN